jgi:GYF domain 2
VVRCPECGTQVRVSGPPSWEDAEPDPAPADPDWFVLVQAKQVGPIDAQALVERIRSGEVHGRTFVWRDGFDGWRRALEVPELLPLLEEAGAPATPPHGPITPADSLSPPGGRTPREATPRRPRSTTPTPVLGEEVLELARLPKRGRTPPPQSDFVRSGLHRKSPWKLALALSGALALPVGGLALFVSLRRPVTVEPRAEAPADAQRTAELAPAAPMHRVQELRDLLLGKRAPPPPPPAPQKRPAAEAKPAPAPAKPEPEGPRTAELRALYGDPRKPDVGPHIRRAESRGPARAGGGPSNEDVARVVGQTQGAFQACIEQQLRKNPGFKGGKVNIVATVGTSGTVKQAQLDRRDLEGTEVGECLRARARRMVFPSFSGDDVDVEIPLVLTTTL